MKAAATTLREPGAAPAIVAARAEAAPAQVATGTSAGKEAGAEAITRQMGAELPALMQAHAIAPR